MCCGYQHLPRKHSLHGLVICSRMSDYEDIAAKLPLHESIVLQPLTDEQIDTYLTQAGDSVEPVRKLLHDDAAMRELANTPLMLNIMILAHVAPPSPEPDTPPIPPVHGGESGVSTPQGGTGEASPRTRLFDRYVQNMFARRGQQKPYSDAQTTHWLTWLAVHLQQHGQTVFQLEQMQPYWLKYWWQRILYVLLSTLFVGFGGALVSAIVVLILCLVFGLGIEGVFFLLPQDALGAMELEPVPSAPGEGLDFVLSGGKNAFLVIGIVAGLISNLAVGLTASIGQLTNTRHSRWQAIAYGVAGGFLSVIPRLLWELDDRQSSIFFSMHSVLLLGMVVGLLVYRRDIHMTKGLRWSWARVRYNWWFVLGTTLLGALGVGLYIGLYVGLGSGVSVGLFIGLFSNLVSILVGGLSNIEIETKMRPNEGTWRSFSSALVLYIVIGLVGGLYLALLLGVFLGFSFGLFFLIFMPTSGLGFGLVMGMFMGMYMGLYSGMFIGFFGGPLVSLYFGGLAFAQHWALRVVCKLYGLTPWNYARFLDYATECVFLRKVGGSYVCVHRTLLEYFAGDRG